MSTPMFLRRLATAAARLTCLAVAVLAGSQTDAARSFIDGVGSGGTVAPTLNDPWVVGDFDNGTRQG